MPSTSGWASRRSRSTTSAISASSSSKAPGHPEYHWVSGVETTTGPLGQGIATSVGMAIARKWLASRYNKPGFAIFDYNIYAVCGDGCLMEGVGSEAASLAGHLGLDDLCWIYDNNHITIEGNTQLAFTEDVAARFLGLSTGTCCGSAMPTTSSASRMRSAVFRETEGPADADHPRQPHRLRLAAQVDTAAAHGEPLGEEEVRLTKRAYGWPEDAQFLVPDGVLRAFRRRHRRARRGGAAALGRALRRLPHAVSRSSPPRSTRCSGASCPTGWDRNLPSFPADPKGIAGRDASGEVLNVLAQNIPWFLGGSADLGSSNKTTLKFAGAGDFEAGSPGGTQSPFRHPRARHGGDRQRHVAVEAAGVRRDLLHLQRLRAAGDPAVGADGAARPSWSSPMTPWATARTARRTSRSSSSSRCAPFPGLVVLRPGDANEVVEAYRYILQLRHQPAVLALSRQPLPTFDRSKYASAAGVARGAYVMADAPGGPPEIILIASGSEVALVVEAHEALAAKGIRSRVVSMPSWDIFEHQPQSYRDSVLPPGVKARLAVEQASALGWERYVGAGPGHRHEDLRRLRAAQGAAAQVRLRAGEGRRGCDGDARPHT